MDNGCFYTCMDRCDTNKFTTDVCVNECNHSCVQGIEAYKKPFSQIPSALYGAPSIQEALQASGPAFSKVHKV